MARWHAARWIVLAVVACLAVSAVCATADEEVVLVEYSVDEYAPDNVASEVTSTEPDWASIGGAGADTTGDPRPILADDALHPMAPNGIANPLPDWSEGSEDFAQVGPYVEEPYFGEDSTIDEVVDEYDFGYYLQSEEASVPGFAGLTESYAPSAPVSSDDVGVSSTYSVFSRSSTLQLLSGLERVLELHFDILRAAAPGFVAPLRPDSPALIQARTNALQQMACGRGSCRPQVGITQTLAIVVDGNSMLATATATEYITIYDNEYMNYDMEAIPSTSMAEGTAMEFANMYHHNDMVASPSVSMAEGTAMDEFSDMNYDNQPEPSILTLPPLEYSFSKFLSSGEFFIQWACLAGLVAFTVCFWVRNFVHQRRVETILVVSESQQSSNMTNPLLASQPEYITITTESLPLLPSGKQAPRDYTPPDMV